MTPEIDELVERIVSEASILADKLVRKRLDEVHRQLRLQSLQESNRKAMTAPARPDGVRVDPELILVLQKKLAFYEKTTTHKNRGVSLIYSPGHAHLSVRLGISNRELQEAMLGRPVSRFTERQIRKRAYRKDW